MCSFMSYVFNSFMHSIRLLCCSGLKISVKLVSLAMQAGLVGRF